MVSKYLFYVEKLLRKADAWFLISVLFIFSLLRIPSLVEPDWYGDEGIYQVIGAALHSGRILYKDIWDNKPPFLYIIYQIFNGDLFSVRLASLVVGAASVVAFFFLSKKLLKTNRSIYIATGFYSVLFGLPFLEGNIANAENFMLLPIILAFYFMLSVKEKKWARNCSLAGLMLSAAFLTKIVAVFDFAALFVSVIMLKMYEGVFRRGSIVILKKFGGKKLVMILREEAVMIISFLIPIIITGVYFFAVGAFSDFFKASFSQNVGYVGYGNNVLFPMGLLFIKLIFLIFALLIVFRYRNIIGKNGVVIIIWLSFSLFNAFFSQRPYTHYVLVILPSFSLFVGYLIENRKLLRVNLILCAVLLFLIFRNFNLYEKIPAYYKNYTSFVFGNRSIDAYQSFFDKSTPRDYAIARFIQAKTTVGEGVFIWGDSGQIYILSGKLPPGRYIVSYHMTFYKDAIDETRQDIEKQRPKYIIQTKKDPALSPLLSYYTLKYKIGDVNIYERQL